MTEEDFEGKNLVELLDMLIPVPEPPAISMWPETQGWIWLGVCLVVLALCALWRWRRMRRANAYRRAALTELERAGDNPVAIAGILRRTALAAYPRERVAGLAGDEWLGFLDANLGKQVFATDRGRAMLAAPYTVSAAPVDGLGRIARDWVRHHKAEVRP